MGLDLYALLKEGDARDRDWALRILANIFHSRSGIAERKDSLTKSIPVVFDLLQEEGTTMGAAIVIDELLEWREIYRDGDERYAPRWAVVVHATPSNTAPQRPSQSIWSSVRNRFFSVFIRSDVEEEYSNYSEPVMLQYIDIAINRIKNMVNSLSAKDPKQSTDSLRALLRLLASSQKTADLLIELSHDEKYDIDIGIVLPLIINALQNYKELELRKGAVKILLKMIEHDNYKDKMHGTILPTLALLKDVHDDEEHLVMDLAIELFGNVEYADEIDDAIRLIIRFVEEGNAFLRSSAVYVLLKLSVLDTCRDHLNGVIIPVIGLLEEGFWGGNTNANTLLNNVFKNDRYKEEIDSAIPNIIRLCHTEARMSAVKMLLTLSENGNYANRIAEAIPEIIGLLKEVAPDRWHRDDSLIMISILSVGAKKRLTIGGVIKVILDLLRGNDEQLREIAAASLATLSLIDPFRSAIGNEVTEILTLLQDTQYYVLQTSDEEYFISHWDVIRQMGTLRDMIEGQPRTLEAIPIYKVSASVLTKVLEYCEHYKRRRRVVSDE